MRVHVVLRYEWVDDDVSQIYIQSDCMACANILAERTTPWLARLWGVTFWRLSVFVCACTCRYDFLGVVHGCVFSRVYFCVRGFSCVHAWVYLLYMEGVLWGVSFCNFSNSGILFAVSPYLSMDVFSGGLPVSTY